MVVGAQIGALRAEPLDHAQCIDSLVLVAPRRPKSALGSRREVARRQMHVCKATETTRLGVATRCPWLQVVWEAILKNMRAETNTAKRRFGPECRASAADACNRRVAKGAGNAPLSRDPAEREKYLSISMTKLAERESAQRSGISSIYQVVAEI